MQILVYKHDRPQKEVDTTGGYAFKRGDVVEVRPDDYVFDDAFVTQDCFIVVKSDILPTHADCLVMSKVYGENRPREYHIDVDNLGLTQVQSKKPLSSESTVVEITQTDVVTNTIKK